MIGFATTVLFLLLYAFSGLFELGANYWLAQWSNARSNGTRNTTKELTENSFAALGVYAGFGLIQGAEMALNVTTRIFAHSFHRLNSDTRASDRHDSMLSTNAFNTHLQHSSCANVVLRCYTNRTNTQSLRQGKYLRMNMPQCFTLAQDMEAVDDDLPRLVQLWWFCALGVVGTLTVIVFSTPWFGVCVVPLLIGCVLRCVC